MRPGIWFPIKRRAKRFRTEKAVWSLAGENGIEPSFRILDDPLVFQHITEIAITFKPIGQLFPSAMTFAIWVGPGVALKLAPGRQFLEMPGHSIGFQLKLLPQPAVRRDTSQLQPGEGLNRQRRAIRNVPVTGNILWWRRDGVEGVHLCAGSGECAREQQARKRCKRTVGARTMIQAWGSR